MRALESLMAPAGAGVDLDRQRRAAGLVLYVAASVLATLVCVFVGDAQQAPWLLAGVVSLAVGVIALIYRFGLRERVWYAIAVLGPATIVLYALAMRHDSDVQLLVLLAYAAWGATYLPWAVERVAIACVSIASFVPFLAETVEPGTAVDAEFHEALLLAFLLAAIAFLVHGVNARQRAASGRLQEERANFVRVADTLGAHIWTGVRSADDVYEPTYIGPGLAVLAGGGLPRDPDAAVEVFRSRIHPDDRGLFAVAYSNEQLRPQVGGAVEVEYRVIGFDDVTRWIRSRCLVHELPGGRLLLDGIAFDVTTEVALRDEARRIAAEVDAARREAEGQAAALRESEQRFRVMIENLPTGAIYLQAGELHLNAAAGRITGLDPSRPVSLDGWFARLYGDAAAEMQASYEADRAAGFPLPREATLRRADGVERLVELVAYAWDEGEVWLLHDVTDRAEAERAREAALGELRRFATTDALTGLANRRYGTERMTRWLERGEPAGVLMLDIDHFKRVNDAYGHQAGDAILIDVAERLTAAARRGDLVTRWGGEEFCVLVRRIEDEQGVAAAGERLRAAVAAQPFELPDGSVVSVTVSAGAAMADGDTTFEPLVEGADRALYLAKRSGRDQVRVASEVAASAPPSEDTDTTRLAQALALATSIREGVPELHCQQVADLSARIAEALGLPAATVRRCRLGGWLHDIGKIAVPDRILAKRGPLDDEEWLVMRSHAAIGDQLAARVPGLDEVRPAIRHHHERWDGTGYPDGLAGEAIPIEGRIVAVADAYSALTSDRVYRRATDQEPAIAELRRSAGAHLDRHVVEVLIAILEGQRRRRAA